MVNDSQIVVRARDFEIAPDVEHYVETLKKNGTLEKLSKEDNLNVKSIKNTSLSKMCDIFTEEIGCKLEVSDIVIFGETGTFEIYSGGGGD
ncbi:hypothetical protein [Nitrosopumilus sp.]|uniref:hypothetical protein n=1 Tax=Nitrosopumilus sp. TaxID=2024843 RepID=UPI003D0D554B